MYGQEEKLQQLNIVLQNMCECCFNTGLKKF